MNPEDMRADIELTRKYIYLDSAATSLKPRPVVEAMVKYFREYCANVERGIYSIAAQASEVYETARETVARHLLHCEPDEFIFARNQTEAANFVAYALEHPFLNRWRTGFGFAPPLVHWTPKSRIVTTQLEHHSNFMPWMRLAKHVGAQFIAIKPTLEGCLLPEMFEESVDENTELVAFQQASNAMGTRHDTATIVRTIKKKNPRALVFIDGAQGAGHMPVDVKTLGCDFYSFSGHKGPLGPPGTGGLYAREELITRMEPEEIGGGTIAAVTAEDYMLRADHRSWRWDAGTPNIVGLIGLGAGVEYLEKIGIHRVEQHERELTRHLLEGLLENPSVEIYGPTEDLNIKAGAVTFNVKGWRCHDVCLALDSQWRVLTRGGHHCCQPMMRLLGILDSYSGNVRASFHFYNIAKEVDTLIEALRRLSS